MVASYVYVCIAICLVMHFLLFLERDNMIEGYMSINSVAEEWGITPRSVRTMCATGKIQGAEKVGRDWLVPNGAVRPADGRVTSGEYKNWRNKKH